MAVREPKAKCLAPARPVELASHQRYPALPLIKAELASYRAELVERVRPAREK